MDKNLTDYPGYSVTHEGHVIGPRGKALKASYDNHGYPVVTVRRQTKGVHIWVALAYYGPRPQGMEVRHLNGDKLDHRPENLAYGTRSENSLDRVKHGMDRNTNKTHCINGHEFSPENTYTYTKRNKIERQCKTCRNARVKACKERAKGVVQCV